MKISTDEIIALRTFAAGPRPVTALFETFSRTRAYVLAKRLCGKGALGKRGADRELLPAGEALLAAADRVVEGGPALPGLCTAVPHLQHAPTVQHRAFLGLGLCARVARLHRLRPTHHPSLVASGPTARFKTWLGQALCLICGGDPAADVIYLGTESGRSLVTRKKADGTRSTIRSLLGRPVAVLDEWLRAKPDVRKLVEIYLFGSLSVPDEGQVLEVLAVPVVTLNPRPGKTLEEQLGLDEAMLRRAIVFQLEAVSIPESVLAEGDDLLDTLRALGPADFPPPRHPTLDVREDVKQILLAALDRRDRLARIDVTMLSMLVVGATAWLDPEAALRAVMTDYLTLVELLGWTRPGWQRALPDRPPPSLQVLSSTELPAAGLGEPNAFDFERRLHAIASGLEKRKLSIEQGADLLARLDALEHAGFSVQSAEALHGELSHHNRSAAGEVVVIADLLCALGTLEANVAAARQRQGAANAALADAERRLALTRRAIARLGWTEAHVLDLRHLDGALRSVGLEPDDLRAMPDGVRAIAAATAASGPDVMGLLPGLLRALRAAVALDGGDQQVLDACRALAGAAHKAARLEVRVIALESERARLTRARDADQRQLDALRTRAAEIRRAIAGLPQQLAVGQRRLADMEAQIESLRDKIALATQLVAWLAGDAGASPHLHRALVAALDARAGGSDFWSQAARDEALGILRRALDPELVTRAELAGLKQAVLQEYRAELEASVRATYEVLKAADLTVVPRGAHEALQEQVHGLRAELHALRGGRGALPHVSGPE